MKISKMYYVTKKYLLVTKKYCVTINFESYLINVFSLIIKTLHHVQNKILFSAHPPFWLIL